MKRIILLIILLANTYCFAQHKLDNYLKHIFENKKMMGSVAISLKDSIIYSKSIGFANSDTKKTIDENTKIRIGSLTKTYTAVLVLKATEEGLLKLDDKLSYYYPQVENSEKITIEHLLKHRTGIFNFTEIPGKSIWEQEFHREEEFINYFIKKKSNFEPNTNYEYSNTNYALLGFILQKIYESSSKWRTGFYCC